MAFHTLSFQYNPYERRKPVEEVLEPIEEDCVEEVYVPEEAQVEAEVDEDFVEEENLADEYVPDEFYLNNPDRDIQEILETEEQIPEEFYEGGYYEIIMRHKEDRRKKRSRRRNNRRRRAHKEVETVETTEIPCTCDPIPFNTKPPKKTSSNEPSPIAWLSLFFIVLMNLATIGYDSTNQNLYEELPIVVLNKVTFVVVSLLFWTNQVGIPKIFMLLSVLMLVTSEIDVGVTIGKALMTPLIISMPCYLAKFLI